MRKKLESEFSSIPDEAWSFLVEKFGTLDDEQDFLDGARDWLTFAQLCANGNATACAPHGQESLGIPSRRGGRRGKGWKYRKAERKRRELVSIVELGRALGVKDWGVQARAYAKATGKNKPPGTVKHEYYQYRPEYDAYDPRQALRETIGSALQRSRTRFEKRYAHPCGQGV